MNFFQRKTSWANYELHIFKVGVWTSGILFGLYFNDFFMKYINIIWIICIPAVIFAGIKWINKMKFINNNHNTKNEK